MVRAWLQRRRAFRARIQREATELLLWLGNEAYNEARGRMRIARSYGHRQGERLWSKVAVEIARRTGTEIGKRRAAKWPDWSRIIGGTLKPRRALSSQPVFVADNRPGPVPHSASAQLRHGTGPNRREIADRLVEISRGIADIAADRADGTTIHNITVEARQILDFTGRTPDFEQAVGELIAACEGVVIAPTTEELTSGIYPVAVAEASRALQRLRSLTLPAN